MTGVETPNCDVRYRVQMDLVILLAGLTGYGAIGGVVGGIVHSRMKRRQRSDPDAPAAAGFFSGMFWPAGIGVAIGLGVSDRAERSHLRRLERIDRLELRQSRIDDLERELGIVSKSALPPDSNEA